MKALIRQESATDFMLRKAYDFREWLTISDPRTIARTRECLRRYPKPYVRHALRAACISNASMSNTFFAEDKLGIFIERLDRAAGWKLYESRCPDTKTMMAASRVALSSFQLAKGDLNDVHGFAQQQMMLNLRN